MNKYQEIIEDINNRDFKNCKKDCYSINCKYIKECSLYHYKNKDEFALEDLMKELKKVNKLFNCFFVIRRNKL